MEHGTALAVTYDDGSVVFYDTRTMGVFNGMDDTSTVTCLAQAGFHYPMNSTGKRLWTTINPLDESTLTWPGISIAFSPNSCVAAVLDSEGQTHIRCMAHTFGSSESLYDESSCSLYSWDSKSR